ncbi:MAG: SulP family inorganic anion transporter [Butyrivibrio sp.]|nr:SulP family inorganic anion transporter [Butyrivibrio sp.]
MKVNLNDYKPKLFSVMKDYNKEQLIKDIISGIIVALIALPLSIALAIASNVDPQKGIYTAIIAGFFIAFLGGSRVQIGGPTAAFVVIICGIINDFGPNGLLIATIMAGIIMIVFGICKAGNLIKFIPYTVTTGFTAGIAVTLAVGQVKDFVGLSNVSLPSEFIEKVGELVKHLKDTNLSALFVGLGALAILIVWPKLMRLLPDKLKYIKLIPESLIAILITTAIVKVAELDVFTIGKLYDVSSKLPSPEVPKISFDIIRKLLSPAFTIAILASIESLLSAVVADGMIGSRHKPNAELIAQGVGNIASAMFGGIPATGAIARTAANIKNGGRTPIAGIVHSITLLIILVVLMPYAKWIPMPTLAAILFIVAYNMSGIGKCIRLCKKAPKSDIIVFALTFLLTVFFDLVVAIEVSLVVAAALFLKRMADTTDVKSWKYIDEIDENEDPDNIRLKEVPKGVLVYEISGPMFFGVTDKFLELVNDTSADVVILRMRGVPAIDASALHAMTDILNKFKKDKVTLVLSHVNEQPLHMMQKAKFDEDVGKENFCANIDEALLRAQEIVKGK